DRPAADVRAGRDLRAEGRARGREEEDALGNGPAGLVGVADRVNWAGGALGDRAAVVVADVVLAVGRGVEEVAGDAEGGRGPRVRGEAVGELGRLPRHGGDRERAVVAGRGHASDRHGLARGEAVRVLRRDGDGARRPGGGRDVIQVVADEGGYAVRHAG